MYELILDDVVLNTRNARPHLMNLFQDGVRKVIVKMQQCNNRSARNVAWTAARAQWGSISRTGATRPGNPYPTALRSRQILSVPFVWIFSVALCSPGLTCLAATSSAKPAPRRCAASLAHCAGAPCGAGSRYMSSFAATVPAHQVQAPGAERKRTL